jgi:hypothetical protein
VTHPIEIARAVRSACVQAALDGYEQAQIAGLCQEGAWEVAVDAIRMVDLKEILRKTVAESPPPPPSRAFFCLRRSFLSSLAKTKRPCRTQPFMPGSQGRLLTFAHRSFASCGQPQEPAMNHPDHLLSKEE